QGRATRSGAPDHEPLAAPVKGRGGEAPSTPSSGDGQPRRRATVVPTRCDAWPRRSAPVRDARVSGECDAVDSNGRPGRRASVAGARSPAATASTTDALSPAKRQTRQPPHAATLPAQPPPPTSADQQVRASHYRAQSSEPPK